VSFHEGAAGAVGTGPSAVVDEEAVPAPRISASRTITIELASAEVDDFVTILREQVSADTDLLEDMAAGRFVSAAIGPRVCARLTLAVRLLALV
jgi:hypothetical protein